MRTTNTPRALSPTRYEGEFVVYEHVAFFKEHTNCLGLPIDRTAIEKICQCCNDRIRDTGDYAPVVLGHTPDKGDWSPEVVGFAGAFYVGVLGNLRPKAAIFGTMWIFAEDAARVKKYPRISVEFLTTRKDPTVGYFDPISLLGAETPELDLGYRSAPVDPVTTPEEKRARYAKQAAKNVLAARARREKMDFRDEFNRLLQLNQ